MIFTVFEDQTHTSLFPLNLNRASFELRCGAFTNLERIQNLLRPDDTIQLAVRDELGPLIQERFPNIIINPDSLAPGVWLNGRGLWTEKGIQEIISGRSFTKNGITIALSVQKDVPRSEMQSYIDDASSVSTAIDIQFIEHIWDGIFLQSDIIARDAQYFLELNRGKIHPSVAIENGDNIFIGDDSEVCAGSVLDARLGPIVIAGNSYIDIGALIQGPVYIGPNCTINPGTKLRGNVTLGPMCKIGGEVEDVIFQGYSNKQHDGFLGHSYIGEWVNLGANTNNSDLKNNYGHIKLIIDKKIIETGKQFLGTMIGDYTRTGISTMFNTGTVVGVGANIFGSGFQEKYIPSFQWGKESKTEFDKFITTIETIKKRRGKTISHEEKEFLSQLFERQK